MKAGVTPYWRDIKSPDYNSRQARIIREYSEKGAPISVPEHYEIVYMSKTEKFAFMALIDRYFNLIYHHTIMFKKNINEVNESGIIMVFYSDDAKVIPQNEINRIRVQDDSIL